MAATLDAESGQRQSSVKARGSAGAPEFGYHGVRELAVDSVRRMAFAKALA